MTVMLRILPSATRQRLRQCIESCAMRCCKGPHGACAVTFCAAWAALHALHAVWHGLGYALRKRCEPLYASCSCIHRILHAVHLVLLFPWMLYSTCSAHAAWTSEAIDTVGLPVQMHHV